MSKKLFSTGKNNSKSFSNKKFDSSKNLLNDKRQKTTSENNNQIWIYGRHPVLMAIANPKRKIYKIIISANHQIEIEKYISEKQIRIDKNLIEIKDNNFINSILPEDAVHQGFALKTLPIAFIEENNFITKLIAFDKKNLPPILILDQLTDPHNIGAIIRSAVAFGVKNIVITKNNSPKENAIICKSSSGMIELVNLIVIGNLNNFLSNLKDAGYWCIGLDGESKTLINEIQDYPAIALIAGSEGDGIRNLVKKNCDLLAKIPMNLEVESLNASNAVAISLYELFGKKINS